MNNKKVFLSICIPSYNRPEDVYRLLKTIDTSRENEIEIVICEDNSPKRAQIRDAVEKFKSETAYDVKYIENDINLGYDRNLQNLIKHASGKWAIFMGDDDEFILGALDLLIDFLKQHDELGYVLRAYQAVHEDGAVEQFRYFSQDQFWTAGQEAYMTMYRKSVFISGFTFKRACALDLFTDEFNGTLLYQLYMVAEICMHYPSAYFNTPITQVTDGGIPYFGSSETEKHLYTPGTVTIQANINFLRGFATIAQYMDRKYKIDSLSVIQRDMSKYFYPNLSIYRHLGRKEFAAYEKKTRELGFGCTIYYYIYYWALYLFGKKFCDSIIRLLKKIIGRTPQL